MKKASLVLLCFIGLFFSGCASLDPYYKGKSETIHVSDRNYVIGKAQEAYVGDAVVDSSDYNKTISSQGEMEAITSFKVGKNNFFAGDKFSIEGYMSLDGKKYRALKARFYEPYLFVDDNDYLINKEYHFANSPVAYNIKLEPNQVQLKNVLQTTYSSDVPNPRFQLLFNGISDNSFFISYREFTLDNLARSSFQQDLTYLKTQKNIRFKNLVIEVISVDNEKIVYKVLQD